MVVETPVIGNYVRLDSCTVEDAVFTRDLRMASDMRECFPAFENTLEEQKEWIQNQREKAGDIYFVIRDSAGDRIGTIGLYNRSEAHAESGRLAIRGDVFQTTEAQLLCLRYGFINWNLLYTEGYIFAGNKRAIRASRVFGTEIVGNDSDEDGREIVRTRLRREIFFEKEKEINRLLYPMRRD